MQSYAPDLPRKHKFTTLLVLADPLHNSGSVKSIVSKLWRRYRWYMYIIRIREVYRRCSYTCCIK